MILGWSINWEKLFFIPSRTIKHLGFNLDTESMTISCPSDKIKGLQSICKKALVSTKITVHDCERMLGKMESVRPSSNYAALRYRSIQRQLLITKGRWPTGVRLKNQIIDLSSKSLLSLSWWISPTGFEGNSSCPIRELSPTVDIWTDANPSMGGAHSSRGEFVQRPWTVVELENDPHINQLEIKAAKEGLARLTKKGDRVRLHVDNTAAVAYIKHQGGTRSLSLCQEATDLWETAIIKEVEVLTPQWIATGENYGADFLSRHKMETWEVQLDPALFQQILFHFQLTPTLDAFLSSGTAQLTRYMSWYLDNNAVARDAILSPWDPLTYLFPPVPLLTKVLQKVKLQGIRAILVCPQWPSALWWTLVQEMLVEPPLPLPHFKAALRTPTGNPVQCYLDPLVAVHISWQISTPQ